MHVAQLVEQLTVNQQVAGSKPALQAILSEHLYYSKGQIMADTLPDVLLSPDAYVDLFDATGITVGDAVIIQNKTSSTVVLQSIFTQPLVTNNDGTYIVPNNFIIVTAGSTGLWARGNGNISVQENS